MASTLKRLRKAAGLNQTKLSAKLGCSQGTISKLETGELSPTVRQLILLREVFAISADSFLDGIIDYQTVARRFGNRKFSLKSVEPEPEPILKIAA